MTITRTLLSRLNEPDEAIEARMIEALDEQLGRPARLELPPGEIVFREDDPIDSIYILLDGSVKLLQDIDGREVIFHSHTVGRILGLLALTRQSRAFFTCETISEVELLKISFTDLDQALQQNSDMMISFVTVLLRAMVRRSTRLVEVQTEVLGLNKRLAEQRDSLARALRELEQAQALLVESEKMATLGQLAAGVAHELNNPVAAINRAADYLRQDLLALAAERPDDAAFKAMLDRVFELNPLSTREQRQRRRALTEHLGDEELAERLVGMGIYEVADYESISQLLTGTPAEKLDRLARYNQLGGALRNITNCSERIANLVKSLRSYSRADHSDTGNFNLHEGLEDTLRLFANRLRDVEVIRQYGEIPPLTGNAGEINQIWTNLIANALDAMHDQGQITIETETARDQVLVRIIDNGPGIPTEHQEKIFNMRYTTRQGRIEFGLGLGLSISRNIAHRHAGAIQVTSQPGRTEFSVSLPLSRTTTTTTPTEDTP
jgi:two-component system, NtrC family, sensor kinase